MRQRLSSGRELRNNSHAAGAAGYVQQAKEEIPIMSNAGKTGLVVTAHPGDFVWRAGGAIALHTERGYDVTVVCLSFGERGESQFAWKEAGATMEKVKAGRRDEAQRADRQLEFTQVDVEVSFATPDLIYGLIEPIVGGAYGSGQGTAVNKSNAVVASRRTLPPTIDGVPKSAIDSTNASSAPLLTAGKTSGSVTLKKRRHGPAPHRARPGPREAFRHRPRPDRRARIARSFVARASLLPASIG